MEPKLTPEEDLKSHRWEVIKEKALEIEKVLIFLSKLNQTAAN